MSFKMYVIGHPLTQERFTKEQVGQMIQESDFCGMYCGRPVVIGEKLSMVPLHDPVKGIPKNVVNESVTKANTFRVSGIEKDGVVLVLELLS